MLEEGFLERWESAEIELDGNGESEAYFPIWGYADPDLYLARSDRLRAELAAQANEAVAEEAARSAQAEELLSAEAAALAMPIPTSMPAEVPATVPAVTRVAWGAWYGAKRVLLVVLVCAVGSLLVTMAMNPDMTFFDVIGLFASKASDLIARISGE